MRIDVLTLFPEMFANVLGTSILKRAADPSLYVEDDEDTFPDAPPIQAPVSYHLTNIRDYSTDKHKKVDKAPFGGGPGMVMQCQPIWDAVQAVESQDPRKPTRILMTPQGKTLTQPMVEAFAKQDRLLIIAGHYEGIDERVIDKLKAEGGLDEISIGDYVLSGGELPAMVLIDAVVRLIPGVLGDDESTHHESFSGGAQRMLDYPHYTKPREWMGMEVPEVLISGDHAKIDAWRKEEAMRRTRERRPDLFNPRSSD
jgi:tRNA (guanine37-N1)-methyltransferase